MVRRHPNVVDPVPGADDGFVFDVSDYPDMADLSLITDVMITDYSSLMFDFVNTGLPILFFTYDLDHYRDTLRGFYFDFEQSAPGPLLFESAELLSAIEDIDRIQEGYADRYAWFQEEFCDLDDGYAAARLTEHILGAGGDDADPPGPAAAATPRPSLHAVREPKDFMRPSGVRVDEDGDGARRTAPDRSPARREDGLPPCLRQRPPAAPSSPV